MYLMLKTFAGKTVYKNPEHPNKKVIAELSIKNYLCGN